MNLEELRNRIDDIDRRLIELLNERAECSLEIGRLKTSRGMAVFDPARESKLFSRLKEINKGPLKDEHILAIFTEIISASRDLQRKIVVGYLGPEGTFTHIAAMKHFGTFVDFVSMRDIRGVFNSVESGNADYGVVPVENSVEGVVSYTLDMFLETSLKVIGELYLRISHFMASNSRKFSKIYGHPQALAQCRRWLEDNFPDIPVFETRSSAEAAIKASKERDAACITTEFAAAKYGLEVLYRHIEDYPNNTTRFWVIGNILPDATGNDKTSVLFSVENVPGALYQALGAFSKSEVNLTKLESRPMKSVQWEYLFFADLNGHYLEPRVSKALKELKHRTRYFKIIGSYPEGKQFT